MAKRVSKTGGKPANPTEERAAAEKKQTAQAKKKNKLVKGGKLGRPRKLTPDQLRRGVEEYFASISYQEPVTREEDIILDVDQKTGGVTFLLDDKGHRVKRIVPVLNAAGKPLTRTVYTEAPGDFGLCNFLKISRDTWERYGRAVELLEERRREQRAMLGAAGEGRQIAGATGEGRQIAGATGEGGQIARATGEGRQISGATGEGGQIAGAAGEGRQIAGATGEGPGPEEDPELREALDYAEIYTLARGRVCAYLESAAETRGGRGAQFKLERIYGLTEKKDVHLDAGGSIEAYLRALDQE